MTIFFFAWTIPLNSLCLPLFLRSVEVSGEVVSERATERATSSSTESTVVRQERNVVNPSITYCTMQDRESMTVSQLITIDQESTELDGLYSWLAQSITMFLLTYLKLGIRHINLRNTDFCIFRPGAHMNCVNLTVRIPKLPQTINEQTANLIMCIWKHMRLRSSKITGHVLLLFFCCLYPIICLLMFVALDNVSGFRLEMWARCNRGLKEVQRKPIEYPWKGKRATFPDGHERQSWRQGESNLDFLQDGKCRMGLSFKMYTIW